MMSITIPDLQPLTDAELDALRSAVEAERVRRWQIATIPEQIADLNRAYLAGEGTVEGEPWRQPDGAHNAYPKGFTVTHVEKTWTSLMDANVWEPGVSGWREVVEGGCPDYVAPTGSHDVYNTGDCVTFEGEAYVSLIDNNSWSPAAYPQGWEKKGQAT